MNPKFKAIVGALLETGMLVGDLEKTAKEVEATPGLNDFDETSAFMAALCVHKAYVELQTAMSYYRRPNPGGRPRKGGK